MLYYGIFWYFCCEALRFDYVSKGRYPSWCAALPGGLISEGGTTKPRWVKCGWQWTLRTRAYNIK